MKKDFIIAKKKKELKDFQMEKYPLINLSTVPTGSENIGRRCS